MPQWSFIIVNIFGSIQRVCVIWTTSVYKYFLLIGANGNTQATTAYTHFKYNICRYKQANITPHMGIEWCSLRHPAAVRWQPLPALTHTHTYMQETLHSNMHTTCNIRTTCHAHHMYTRTPTHAPPPPTHTLVVF